MNSELYYEECGYGLPLVLCTVTGKIIRILFIRLTISVAGTV